MKCAKSAVHVSVGGRVHRCETLRVRSDQLTARSAGGLVEHTAAGRRLNVSLSLPVSVCLSVCVCRRRRALVIGETVESNASMHYYECVALCKDVSLHSPERLILRQISRLRPMYPKIRRRQGPDLQNILRFIIKLS